MLEDFFITQGPERIWRDAECKSHCPRRGEAAQVRRRQWTDRTRLARSKSFAETGGVLLRNYRIQHWRRQQPHLMPANPPLIGQFVPPFDVKRQRRCIGRFATVARRGVVMKLTSRFLVLVLTLLVAVGVCAQQGVRAIDRLGYALQVVVDSDMERVFAITHVRRLFRSMVVLESDYLLTSSSAERNSQDGKMAALAAEQLRQIEKYARLMPSEDAVAIVDIRAARARWIELDTSVRVMAAGDATRALTLSRSHGQDPVNWEKVIGKLVKLSETRLSARVAETKLIHTRARRNLLLIAAGAATLALSLGFFIFLGIRRAVSSVIALNSNLERQVADRTETLAQRERSLRLVLDSTGEALITLDRNGVVVGATSAASIRWFGECAPGYSGARYLFRDATEQQVAFELAYGQLVDDWLPWELALDQMPRRIETGDAVLALDYKRISGSSEFAEVLVIARDVSAAVRSEASEKSSREQQQMIARLLEDKAGFSQFVSECEGLLAALSDTKEPDAVKRLLHTLKGNAAVYGVASVADYCHELESIIATSDEPLPASALAELQNLWRTRLQSLEGFISNIGRSVLEIDIEEHQSLIESLMRRQDYQEIAEMVEMWSWCRASERLTRLQAQTIYVARRLGKEVEVVLQHNDLRLPRDYLGSFWPTLIHVVRNAIDHGLESTDERLVLGKPPRGMMVLAILEAERHVIVEVRDDGRGLDVARLHNMAEARGIHISSEIPLEDLVSIEGLSTRDQVSDTSGRGIGLAAVRHACEQAGGKFIIENRPAEGVTFQFHFAKPTVKTGASAEKLARRWTLVPSGVTIDQQRGSRVQRLDEIRGAS